MQNNSSINYIARLFRIDDLPQVVDLWNRTAQGRALYSPLSEKKVKAILLEKSGFDRNGFFIAEDGRGIAGGIAVSTINGEGNCALLQALFTRTGRIKNAVSQFLMNEAFNYLKMRGMKKIRTTTLSQIDSNDLEMLEFLWLNRFIVPVVYDQLIDCNIPSIHTFLDRDLENFSIPDEILKLQKELESTGYKFSSYSSNKNDVPLDAFEEFPFAPQFKNVIKLNSPLEHLFLAFHNEDIIGGALASLPFAPTDWILYGCDCGLFGPTGVARRYRGAGVGKALLFQSIKRLRELNCHRALIPTNASTYPFYEKAGFSLKRVGIYMERSLEQIKVRFKEVS